MKRIKLLSLLVVIGIVAVLALRPGNAAAEENEGGNGEEPGVTETEPEVEGEKELSYTVEYGKYRIDFNCEVYFQFVKAANQTTVKNTAWIPAPASDGHSFVDFSDLKKTSYVAVTRDPKATTPEAVVDLVCPVKSIKTAVNYLDASPADLYAALALIEVKDEAGTTVTYDGTAAKKTEMVAKYGFEWKRGMNGTWHDATDEDVDFALEYNMIRSTSSTLYIRVNKAVVDDELQNVLPSKEAKVKIGKTAVQPNIKQDYKRGTLSVKNGMEFEYNGKAYYVPAFLATSKVTGAVQKTNDDVSTKVSALSVEELVDLLREDGAELKSGDAFEIKVRTSANKKKYASWPAVVEIQVPIEAPATEDVLIRFEYCSADNTLRIAFDGTPVEGRNIQYALGGEDADIAQLKFTDAKKKSGEFVSVKLDAKIGIAAEYTNKDGDKVKNLKSEEAILYYRYTGVASGENKAHPGICAKMTAQAVEQTTITTLDEQASSFIISFVTTVTDDVEGGGADVIVGEETVKSITSEGEEVKFKVTPKTVLKDEKERSVEVTVKLSGKALTADKDGFYTTGTLTKGGVVMIVVTYGEPTEEGKTD